MSLTSEEMVLVIPLEHFVNVGYFEGFRRTQGDYATRLLDPAAFRFLPRPQAERDPAFKQIIPYCVLASGDALFHYQRGAGGGEKRLESLHSLGIGGHINPIDSASGRDIYQAAMQRELTEEVEYGNELSRRLFGFIYDPSLAVGQVHLGVVHRIELEAPYAKLKETKLQGGGFESFEKLLLRKKEFETWSQLILEAWN
ncbi:phosphoesterase [Telmatocola sphagniphila]|uniref:Phosphoesterase n=1 Tax=Telmatocola sphagniphila TaxID=1123043 RepID=A0A8E6BCQ3_9BACT|nr:phosphoesterase [Telmatocola sphagniphila]QVL34773.1 phosphoesterase [Telmatocola sphagniphila]